MIALLCHGRLAQYCCMVCPRFFVFVFSFVIVLVFVRFACCNFYFYLVFVFQIAIVLVFVLTERSAIVLVFVFVFVTKIALTDTGSVTDRLTTIRSGAGRLATVLPTRIWQHLLWAVSDAISVWKKSVIHLPHLLTMQLLYVGLVRLSCRKYCLVQYSFVLRDYISWSLSVCLSVCWINLNLTHFDDILAWWCICSY